MSTLERHIIFTNDHIAASGSISSSWLPLYASHTYQGINLYIRGSGTAQISYQLSTEDSPDDNQMATSEGNIASGLTEGAHHYDIAPKVSLFIRIVATETGGANAIDGISATFIQQGRGF